MFVCVAGHIFEIVGGGENLRELLPNFCPFEVERGEVEVGGVGEAGDIGAGKVGEAGEAVKPLFTLRLDVAVALPLAQPVVQFDYTLAFGERVRMSIYPSGERVFSIKVDNKIYSMFCYQVSGWRFESDALLRGAPRYIIDHFAVQAFSLAVLPLETLLIHASTIFYNGSAIPFLAESGTGKSTHTRLWRENIAGAQLLNDDAPAVRIIDGAPVAFGTPWSGKLSCYRNESYPIRAFVRIRRAEFNKMTLLGRLQSIAALVPSCLPTLQRTDGDLDGILATLSAVISSTEIYTLDCLPNAEAAITANSELF